MGNDPQKSINTQVCVLHRAVPLATARPTSCLSLLQAETRTRTHTRTRAHEHARTRTHAHVHTHTHTHTHTHSSLQAGQIDGQTHAAYECVF